MARLKTYKHTRNWMYRWARTMGNWQPWLETFMGDGKGPRKIVRRYVHRRLGRMFSKQLFGNGLIAKAIKTILGL